jgi:nucleotide-binding universal stress UspA family protein
MPVIGEAVSLTIDNILVPTDFGPASKRAVALAKEVAQRFRSSVELVNVINESSLGSVDGSLLSLSKLQDEAKIGLDLTAKEFADTSIDLRITVLQDFSPSAAVLQIANDSNAQLIVVGTTSKQGFEKLILGSTAEQIIRQARCPVLSVGPHADLPSGRSAGFRNILYATDFSPEAARAGAYALSFAEDSQANLYLCHVLDVWTPSENDHLALERSYEAALRRLIPNCAYDWCSPECIVKHGDAAEAILTLAEKVKADLIVLGARKSSFWLNHVEQGMTPTLLASATCPILTIS